MKKIERLITAAIFVLALNFSIFAAISVDGLLSSRINAAPLGLTPVIITFDHQPTQADFTVLKSLGITGGRYLSQLPIVLTKINKTQFNALKARSGIRSLYANRVMKLMDR